MTPEEYEAQRAAKVDRLNAHAEKLRAKGTARLKAGDRALEAIPLGQPILVGHHSEGRDRRYRARAFNNISKGLETIKAADRLAQRAAAAASNTAIFSDDPSAVEKLEEKVARLEKRQALMVATNKLVRKKDREGLADLGFGPKMIEGLFTPDFCGRLGFPNYALTNNSANIRRLKARVTEVTALQARPAAETVIGNVRVFDNPDENRLQLFFPGKPDEVTRGRLKSRGFRWSPYNGCWQRHLSNGARYDAEYAITGTNQPVVPVLNSATQTPWPCFECHYVSGHTATCPNYQPAQ